MLIREVKHLFRKKTNKWVHLQVKANKQVETITCTPNHRIYIKNKGWIKASEIVSITLHFYKKNLIYKRNYFVNLVYKI